MAAPKSAADTQRIRDLAIYLAVGLAFAGGALWVAGDTDWSADEVSKWLGLFFASAILFGTTIRDYRGHAKEILFWSVLLVLLCLHLILFLLVVRTVGQWRLAWWIFAVPPEVVVVRLALLGLGFRPSRHAPKKRSALGNTSDA